VSGLGLFALAGVRVDIVEELALPAGVEDIALKIPPMRNPARPSSLD
jgi:hypothetical protein